MAPIRSRSRAAYADGMTWAGVGAAVIGIVVAYISMMFITRAVEKDASATHLAGFIAVLFGGTVVEFLASKIGANPTQFAQYGIGLGIGFLLYVILYWIAHHGPPTLNGVAARLT
jgi:hypothetical protein